MRLKHQNTPKLLRNHVYQQIKQDIISGVYASGLSISPDSLAKRHRVSLTPVREAFHALQKEGLIEIIPRVGYFVSSVTVKDIQDIFSLRVIIEGAAAELAAQNITDEELRHLDEVRGSYKSGDTSSYWKYLKDNHEFHYGIAVATRNRWLAESVERLLDQVERFVFLALDREDYVKDILVLHPKVLAALRDRDSVKAKKAMVEGVEKTRDAVLDAVMRGKELHLVA
jgi:DNA-binding GntR family transcriptional regulator